jgi:hypothetical protein
MTSAPFWSGMLLASAADKRVAWPEASVAIATHARSGANHLRRDRQIQLGRSNVRPLIAVDKARIIRYLIISVIGASEHLSFRIQNCVGYSWRLAQAY